jgi:hypothetical protein
MNEVKLTFSYDSRCQDLAEVFLPSTASERLKQELAQEIQNAIENWIEAERDRLRGEIGIGESGKLQMTGPDFNHPLVGRAVVYRGSHPNAEAEDGIITSVNVEANIVFVRYRSSNTSQGTTPDDRLTFTSGGYVAAALSGARP